MLKIRGSQGYAIDQAKTITVGELKELIQGYDNEDEIVLYDMNNGYGAKFGTIVDIEEDYDDEDDEDFIEDEDLDDEEKTGAVIIDGTTILTATHKDIS